MIRPDQVRVREFHPVELGVAGVAEHVGDRR